MWCHLFHGPIMRHSCSCQKSMTVSHRHPLPPTPWGQSVMRGCAPPTPQVIVPRTLAHLRSCHLQLCSKALADASHAYPEQGSMHVGVMVGVRIKVRVWVGMEARKRADSHAVFHPCAHRHPRSSRILTLVLTCIPSLWLLASRASVCGLLFYG